MKKTIPILLVSTISFCLCCCQKSDLQPLQKALFDSVPAVKQLIPIVNELSGIADSKINLGYLWGVEDSGNPNEVYLIRHDGNVAKKVYLKGIVNRDWEDMCLANGAIYIAETGDNAGAYVNYMIYKFDEPSVNTDTVSSFETINFTYLDGSHDAEAFLVDEAKNIYIITKSDNPSKIYKLAYPYSTNNTVSLMGNLPYGGVASATMNANEIIVKTYPALYYYKRQANQSIEQTLKTDYTPLPYVLEPQGEAVSFANDGSGYYTISEKGFGTTVKIYFYKRN